MKISNIINTILILFSVGLLFVMFWVAAGKPSADSIVRFIISTPADRQISLIRQDITYSEHIKNARDLATIGKFELAHLHLDAAQKLEPEKDEPKIIRAKIFKLRKQHTEIINTLENIENTPEITKIRVRAFIALSRFDEALTFAGSGATWERAALLTYFQKRDEAEKVLEQIEKMNETNKTNKTKILLKALRLYDDSSDVKEAQIRLTIARALYETQEYKLAAAKALKVVQTEPTYRDAWHLFGIASLAMDENSAAYQALSEALAQDSSQVDVRIALAHAAINLSKFDEANTHISFIRALDRAKAADELQQKLDQKLGTGAFLK